MVIDIGIKSSNSSTRKIIIEPWAEEFYLAYESEYKLRIFTPKSLDFYIEVVEDYIVISVPSGSVCTLLEDGSDISKAALSIPVP